MLQSDEYYVIVFNGNRRYLVSKTKQMYLSDIVSLSP